MKTQELKPAVTQWLEELEIEGEKKPNTIKQYTRSLDKFIQFVESEKPEEINKATALAYKKYMLEELKQNQANPKAGRTQVQSLSTVNIRIDTLNRFFRWANCAECCINREKDRDQNLQKNVLTEKEYKRMLEWADKLGNKRMKLIMETLAGTGIRISELAGVTVEALKTRTFTINNKDAHRTGYIPKQLTKELKAYCKENGITEGIIFHGRDKDKLLDQSVIRKEIKHIAGKARGIKRDKAHAHNFRHLFARRYANMPNPNPYVLPLLLGHSINGLPVTFRYTQPSPEELLKIVDEIEVYYSEPKRKGRKKK